MFVSQDKNVKKKFQKPNILRRKTKGPLARPPATSESLESPDAKSLVTTSLEKSLNAHEGQSRIAKQIVIKHREKPNQFINKSTQKVISASSIPEDNSLTTLVKTENVSDITFTIITTQDNSKSAFCFFLNCKGLYITLFYSILKKMKPNCQCVLSHNIIYI